MAEPWPVTHVHGDPEVWIVKDDSGSSGWFSEQAARRLAALPVLLAACRRVAEVMDGNQRLSELGRNAVDQCIAALKAAGEEIG